MLWPNGSKTRPTITKNGAFGPRKSPGGIGSTNHLGTDFVGFTVNRAVADGRVITVARHDGKPPGATRTPSGNEVVVQHDGYRSRYKHNASVQVVVGQEVVEGQQLGIMGATGAVTGKHLHFSIYKDGQYIDPVPFITARIGTSGGTSGGNTSSTGGNTTTPPLEGLIMAEAIVAAPNGVVVHLRAGGKTNFSTAAEYNTFRDQVAFLRKQGATDLMPLPPLAKVPKVTWDTFTFLCAYMGAPAS